jgi:UPF0176 protein
MSTTPDTDQLCVLSFYQFVRPLVSHDQVERWRREIGEFLKGRIEHAKGLVLVSVEGINGTLCFPSKDVDLVEQFLGQWFPSMQKRRSWSPVAVFSRLLVKIRHENVTLGPIGDHDAGDHANVLRIDQVGEYVQPGPSWNELLNDPDCLVVDTRNTYEVGIGTFQGAVQPETTEFREFPTWIQEKLQAEAAPKKIAMFCTGGIRCEKATAYVLDQMRKDKLPEIPVYHLQGGILAYLDTVPKEESLFEGECYVFDKRTAVTHGLRPTETFVKCFACRLPVDKEECQGEQFQTGVFCPHCVEDRKTLRQRYLDRQIQFEAATLSIAEDNVNGLTESQNE